MKSSLPGTKKRRRLIMAPFVVLAIGLISTIVGAYYVYSTTNTRDRLHFHNNAQLAKTTLETRIDNYISVLRSGAAVFSSVDDINRDRFHAFARRLDLREHYPGFQGVGYSRVVKPEEVDSFTRQMKAQGITDFQIKPDTPRSEYHVIVFLEPDDRRNRAAIGFDMFTDPIRREAMERARDTDDAAATGRVELIQEIDSDKQAGFLIYVPVYTRNFTPNTVAERRASLRGFIYSPFRADDFLNDLLGVEESRSVDLEVYDGSVATPENLLHKSARVPDQGKEHYVETAHITVAGQPWTIVFSSRAPFEYGSGHYLVPLTITGGLALSLLLFGLTRSQARARQSAEEAAQYLFESQEALRQNEARLRRLVEANIIGLIIADSSGHIVEANDAFLQIIGYSREDLTAGRLNSSDITPAEYQSLDAEAIDEMRRTGSHSPFEKEYLRKDGSRVPVLIGTAHVGGPSDLSVGFILDLSERKRAEAALREADLRAITEYEQLLDRITGLAQALGTARDLLMIYRGIREFAVRSVPCDGIFISLYDSRKQVSHAVYAWGENQEIDVTELPPQPLSDDGPKSRAVNTGQVVITNDYIEAPEAHSLLIIGNEFGQHPESALAAPLSVMGRIVGTIEVYSLESDSYTNEHVTAMRMAANLAAVAIENVQLLDRESRARALAEESNRLKDEFLATVSHELRTPLTAILGWARMLIMGGFDEPTMAKALETIERNAAAQAQIIGDILDVSRAITGKIALEITPTDFARLVEASIDSVKLAADAKGITVVRNIRCAGCVVSGDTNRLQQVVWNLLANAVKFTPAGGRINITLERDGYELMFRVADSGEGMTKEFLPYAFDRFRQADSSYTRSHGGLGLGLAIVKHLVELHGGTVTAESSGPGLGATFTVTLPLIARDQVPTPVAVRPEATTSNGNLAGLNVLVVDDEPDTVEMLKAVLNRDGVNVSTAYSVQEALSSLSRSRPDVIISDLGMPDEDGYELARRVRSMRTASGGVIPMIALTAYAHDEAREESLQRGFMEHLAKPVDPEVLKHKIAAIARSQTI